MQIIFTILRQVIIMFVLAFIGYLMFRTKKITNEGSKSIGNMLIYLSLPCVIINSFLVERTPEKVTGLLLSAAAAFILIFLSVGLSRLVLGRNAIDNFSGSFSNPGFFGIPLIVASLSSGAVFYIAAYIAFLNMGQWTYGVWLLTHSDDGGNIIAKAERKEEAAGNGSGKGLLLRLVRAPFMVAILLGLFFFVTGLQMPAMAAKCIDFIAGLNTPLAMFTIGIYLAQTDLKKMFGKLSLYRVAFVRMLLVPLASIAVLSLIPGSMLEMKLALLIAEACPVGSNVAVYAQLHNKNYSYAVETVVISTALSIVTIPLIVGIATMLWI